MLNWSEYTATEVAFQMNLKIGIAILFAIEKHCDDIFDILVFIYDAAAHNYPYKVNTYGRAFWISIYVETFCTDI